MRAETVEVDESVDLRSLWQELAADSKSPDRFELTEHGEIVLSPLPTNRHQIVVEDLAAQLRAQLGGAAPQNLAVMTTQAGVRCPDIAWLPEKRVDEAMTEGPLEVMPPLMVEVLSPGNRKLQIAHKVHGYLQSGAKEVVVIGPDGSIDFHRADGAHPDSVFGLRLTVRKGP